MSAYIKYMDYVIKNYNKKYNIRPKHCKEYNKLLKKGNVYMYDTKKYVWSTVTINGETYPHTCVACYDLDPII